MKRRNIFLILIILFQVLFITSCKKEEVIKDINIENNVDSLDLEKAKQYANEIVRTFNKTNETYKQWDWSIKFNQITKENKILALLAYKQQFIQTWEDSPIYKGFQNALSDMQENKNLNNEEQKELIRYIKGYEIEHNDALKNISDCCDNPTEIYIDFSQVNAKYLIKGYHKKDKEFVDEYIELDKFLDHLTTTEENKKRNREYAYAKLFNKLERLRRN